MLPTHLYHKKIYCSDVSDMFVFQKQLPDLGTPLLHSDWYIKVLDWKEKMTHTMTNTKQDTQLHLVHKCLAGSLVALNILS